MNVCYLFQGYLGIDSGLQTITALPNDFDFEETLSGLRSGYTYSFEVRLLLVCKFDFQFLW